MTIIDTTILGEMRINRIFLFAMERIKEERKIKNKKKKKPRKKRKRKVIKERKR